MPVSPPPTVGAALEAARRALAEVSDSAGLDAQVLLAKASGADRAWLLAHPDTHLTAEQAHEFQDSVDRCRSGESLAYVLGEWEFFGRTFQVTHDVLIPRPETELLVEHALEFLRRGPGIRMVADVGTGSGCIAVTLLAEIETVTCFATDLSLPALQVARKNATAHRVEARLLCGQMDLLGSLAASFPLICANLPYVPSMELATLAVGQREPRLALDGGLDGLAHLRHFFAELPGRLAPGGRALLEIADDQGGAALTSLRAAQPALQAWVVPDLAGRDRLLVIERDGA